MTSWSMVRVSERYSRTSMRSSRLPAPSRTTPGFLAMPLTVTQSVYTVSGMPHAGPRPNIPTAVTATVPAIFFRRWGLPRSVVQTNRRREPGRRSHRGNHRTARSWGAASPCVVQISRWMSGISF